MMRLEDLTFVRRANHKMFWFGVSFHSEGVAAGIG